MFRRIIFFGLIVCFLAVGPVSAYSNPGQPTGFVNDFADILNDNQESQLEDKLSSFKELSSNEVALVTIGSLEGDTIENYAVKLFEDWGIGGQENDNGVLLLVAVSDRQIRIETGYGLEGALPDATAFQIISKTIEPAFREGDYYSGLDKATDDIIAATQGEYEAAPTTPGFLKRINFESLFWLLIFVFYALSSLWRWMAKSQSWWQGGIIGAILGLIIALIFFQALWYISVFVLGGLGLLVDFLVSRILPAPRPRKNGKGIWFIGGPGGFGGGSSGGGFGGFGGGRSGGGGASGSW